MEALLKSRGSQVPAVASLYSPWLDCSFHLPKQLTTQPHPKSRTEEKNRWIIFPLRMHFRNNIPHFFIACCSELYFLKLHLTSEEVERCNIYSKWQYVQLKRDILLAKEE